jgi:major membrane immunogen (membrane-anchored lipoprotein)
MKRLTVIVLAALFLNTSCNSGDKSTDAKKDKYEATKETLAETEKKNPLRFLSVTSKDKKNLLKQTVTKGEIKNNASVAVFKDVAYKIMYYSETGTLLAESADTEYSKIAPGKTVSFKTKEWAPKGTDSVVIKIVSAKSE